MSVAAPTTLHPAGKAQGNAAPERPGASDRSGKQTERSSGAHQAPSEPLHAAKIEDYAVIGDCETAALVCRDGSLDWLCWPDFSSSACFASLLGTKEHGYYKIKPAAEEEITGEDWRYKPHTLIVEKTWTTRNGEVCVSDFMPPRGKHSDVVRIVRGVRGTVKMRMDFVIRFDYGRTVPWVERVDHHLRAIAGPELVVLRTEAPLRGEDMTTVSDFEIREGETVCFTLSYGSSIEEDPEPFDALGAYRETEEFWTDWAAKNTYRGQYRDCVERSLMTLKALTYRPSGGLVAAVTTSLPEEIGGSRNWDYRLCWLRDTAFTLLVLLHVGYTEEAMAWRGWVLRAVAGSADQVQSLYGLRGERQLTEWSPDWLPGYEHSLPVRIGNGAQTQVQLDIYGEIISALTKTPFDDGDPFADTIRSLIFHLLEHLESIWREPDEGIWEVRGPKQHFVHSKMMVWVAFDRAVKAYEEHADKTNADLAKRADHWRQVRAEVHADVCRKGFDQDLNSFVQAYGSKQLDAACLRMLLTGFLPVTDPRMLGTVAAIEKHLVKDGLVLRYNTADGGDGLPGSEGAFLACSFWLVGCMHLLRREEEARSYFEHLMTLRNSLGLLAEEYDTTRKRQVGNFPQAFTHLTMVHAAIILDGGAGPWTEAQQSPGAC